MVLQEQNYGVNNREEVPESTSLLRDARKQNIHH